MNRRAFLAALPLLPIAAKAVVARAPAPLPNRALVVEYPNLPNFYELWGAYLASDLARVCVTSRKQQLPSVSFVRAARA